MHKSILKGWALPCLLAITLGLFLTGALLLPLDLAGAAETAITINSVNPADSILVVSLPTNDIVFKPAEEKIYASVPGSTIGNGNTITAVDPRTGAIGNSVFVGSEPTKLALASDGRCSV